MPESDAFFKFLLALGLAENDRLNKLLVVDRRQAQSSLTNGSLETRWKEMLESVFVGRRFDFLGDGFAQFVNGPLQYHLRRGEQIS